MISSIPTKRSRKRKKPHTTYKGRIVYERKKHDFSINDILRISAKLPAPTTIAEGIREIALIAKIAVNILLKINLRVVGFEFAWGIVDMVVEILKSFLNEIIQGKAEDFLRKVGLVAEEKPYADEMQASANVQLPDTAVQFTLGDLWYWTDPVTGFKWERVWNGLH